MLQSIRWYTPFAWNGIDKVSLAESMRKGFNHDENEVTKFPAPSARLLQRARVLSKPARPRSKVFARTNRIIIFNICEHLLHYGSSKKDDLCKLHSSCSDFLQNIEFCKKFQGEFHGGIHWTSRRKGFVHILRNSRYFDWQEELEQITRR